MSSPKVTVYIPCQNHGRFLAQAIDSVIHQTFCDWELIVIDDGSQDEAASVASRYEKTRPGPIRVLRHTPSRGLPACANLALEAARGEYVMRLDADDFLDENALLVLSCYLDRHPEVALVYPNFIYVDEEGRFLAVENRKKIGTEAAVLDLPAHGACTMVRRRVLKAIGGYSEKAPLQDGYELWLKVLHRYPVANVTTPLFCYRQHEQNLTRDPSRVLEARRQIKRHLVGRNQGKLRPRVAAVIPAKNTYASLPDVALTPLAGRPLVDYSLAVALESGLFETILVTTDDPRVVEHCGRSPGVRTVLRPAGLSSPRIRLSQVLHHAVEFLENELRTYPDILVLLSIHSPLRRAEQIVQAVDALLLHGVNSVLSVYEDYDLHFAHGRQGLEPINRGMLQKLRLEREVLYVDNGAIKACWRDVVTEEDCLGRTVGHIVMPLEESFQIKRPFDLQLIEQILLSRSQTEKVPV